MKPKTEAITLTKMEAKAAYEACLNYTPEVSSWKQAAQTRVVRKLQLAMFRINRQGRKDYRRKLSK